MAWYPPSGPLLLLLLVVLALLLHSLALLLLARLARLAGSLLRFSRDPTQLRADDFRTLKL